MHALGFMACMGVVSYVADEGDFRDRVDRAVAVIGAKIQEARPTIQPIARAVRNVEELLQRFVVLAVGFLLAKKAICIIGQTLGILLKIAFHLALTFSAIALPVAFVGAALVTGLFVPAALVYVAVKFLKRSQERRAQTFDFRLLSRSRMPDVAPAGQELGSNFGTRPLHAESPRATPTPRRGESTGTSQAADALRDDAFTRIFSQVRLDSASTDGESPVIDVLSEKELRVLKERGMDIPSSNRMDAGAVAALRALLKSPA